MPSFRPLPAPFYRRDTAVVARDLLGCRLIRRFPGGERRSVVIVETEAYRGEKDRAAHTWNGRRTPRVAPMWGPGGHAYVYFVYGMHFCMNVVTESEGRGSAVLLRAAEPLQGHEAMAERRGTSEVRRLCSGPARWTQAFGIARQENGADLVRGREVYLLEGEPVPRSAIRITTRVGVNVGIERPWRFLVAQSPFVSPGRPSRITG